MSKLGNQLKTKIVLQGPRVTEKSTVLADRKCPVYVFEVAKGSTKEEIRQAFKTKYKVTPTKVNVVNLPRKKTIKRGHTSTQSGVRKAMIYLKEGVKIEIT